MAEMCDESLGPMLPRIITEVPGPNSVAYAERLRKVESPAASMIKKGHRPVFWEQTRGANVKDADGNVFIDLTSAFCVAAIGHSNPRVVEAAYRQGQTMMHSQGVVTPSLVRLQLLEKLADLAPGEQWKSHLASTGAEAVEVCYKTARLYTGRHGFIAFQNGFHGKTGIALTLTTRSNYRKRFLPLVPGVVHVPFANCYRCPIGHTYPDCHIACAEYVAHIIDDPDSGTPDVAAMILEPVQGNGVIVPPIEFLAEMRRVCTERGILLIFDEVATGFGRTGSWFAAQTFNVTPDIMSVGKSMASGFPISAMMAKADIAEPWGSGEQSSTFLGHPVGCAAALASIAEIEERGLLTRCKEVGGRFKDGLLQIQKRHRLVGDIRGVGMLMGVELVKDRKTKIPAPDETWRVLQRWEQLGVFAKNPVGSFGNVLRLTPPLIITQEQVDYALRTLDESLTNVEGELKP
jgi:4-aminobutyrate aminotransferase